MNIICFLKKDKKSDVFGNSSKEYLESIVFDAFDGYTITDTTNINFYDVEFTMIEDGTNTD